MPLLSRSGLVLGARAVAVALFWAAGLASCARPARAGGCHAPERPVLGLTTLADEPVPGVPALDRAPARFAPVPCSGGVPGSSARALPARSPAIAQAGWVAP